MNSEMIVSSVAFMMKYFFNVEKELTLQLVNTLQLKLFDLKDVAIHYAQLLAAHK